MSATLMGCAQYTPLPAHLKQLLVALADEADDDGSNCYPGRLRLAVKTSTQERNVRRNIVDLELRGYVVREIGAGGGQRVRNDRRPNLYLLNAERIIEEAAIARDMVKRGDAHVLPWISTGGTPTSPRENARGDTHGQAGGRPRPPVTAYGGTPTSPDPVFDPLKAPPENEAVASDQDETETLVDGSWLWLIRRCLSRAQWRSAIDDLADKKSMGVAS